MQKTISDAMVQIDLILQRGWWMDLRSPFTPSTSWFCGLTPAGTTGWNGTPDIYASGATAIEAILNCCEKWEKETVPDPDEERSASE